MTAQHINIPGSNKKLVLLLDGKPMILDRDPFIVNGRTMVLLRPLVTAAGGELEWQGEQGTAQVQGRMIAFTLGAPQALVDGRPFSLDHPLVEIDNRVVAPVTIWRQLFAGRLGYETAPRCVWLRSPETVASTR